VLEHSVYLYGVTSTETDSSSFYAGINGSARLVSYPSRPPLPLLPPSCCQALPLPRRCGAAGHRLQPAGRVR
jgi:hypothetical protein